MDQDLRFPIGEFKRGTKPTDEQRGHCIEAIAEAPAQLTAAVAGLRKKDCSVALQEVLDWIGYEQRDICWKVSIL